MFRPRYVGVCAWQFGQSSRRLISRLSSRLPLIWSSSRGMGSPFQVSSRQISHRGCLRPARISRLERARSYEASEDQQFFHRACRGDGNVGSLSPRDSCEVRGVDPRGCHAPFECRLSPTTLLNPQLGEHLRERAGELHGLEDLLIRLGTDSPLPVRLEVRYFKSESSYPSQTVS